MGRGSRVLRYRPRAASSGDSTRRPRAVAIRAPPTRFSCFVPDFHLGRARRVRRVIEQMVIDVDAQRVVRILLQHVPGFFLGFLVAVHVGQRLDDVPFELGRVGAIGKASERFSRQFQRLRRIRTPPGRATWRSATPRRGVPKPPAPQVCGLGAAVGAGAGNAGRGSRTASGGTAGGSGIDVCACGRRRPVRLPALVVAREHAKDDRDRYRGSG